MQRMNYAVQLQSAVSELMEIIDSEKNVFQQLGQMDTSNLYRLLADELHSDIDELSDQLKEMLKTAQAYQQNRASALDVMARLLAHLKHG